MKPIHLQKSSHKFWAAVFSVLALLCVGVIVLFRFLPLGHTAVLYKDGKEIRRIRLDTVTQSYTIPLDGNTVLVEPGKISMLSADCPDKLCIHQGTLTTQGRIVCLPNRVLIEMVREKATPDAKVG